MHLFGRSAVLFLLASFIPPLAGAQEQREFEITRLTEHLYKLSTDVGYAVNIIASIGEDGILLVDTGTEDTAAALKEALKTISDEQPKIIINTHAHVEHLGGNALWGRDAVIIAHQRVREHMRSGRWIIMEYPDEALPDVTFQEPVSVYFNGEEIRLIPLTGSHSDDDVIVHFTRSAIACTSGIINGGHFPSVDSLFGDVLQYPAAIEKIIALLPDDVTVICPHGSDCTMDDVRAYHDMIVRTMDIVGKGLDAGKDLATLQEEKVLAEWDSFAGGYVSADRWIQYIVDGLQHAPRKIAPIEPLYLALKEGGMEAAIAKYRELKKTRPDEYKFDAIAPIVIARRLLKKDRAHDAARLLEMAVEECPDSPYLSLVHQDLGAAYRALGDTEQAVHQYRKVLELDPENTAAAQALKELEAE
jgi:cyclase